MLSGFFLFLSAQLVPESSIWRNIVREFGVTAVAAVIIHFLSTYYLYKDLAENIWAFILQREKVLKEITDVYPNRVEAKIDDRLRSAKKQIDIMITSLEGLTTKHDAAKPLHAYFLDMIENHEVHLRILTLDPRNDFKKTRFCDLDKATEQAFGKEMVAALARFTTDMKLHSDHRDQTKRIRGSIEIRAYNRPPSVMYYRIDDDAFIGFILITEGQTSRARYNPFFEIPILDKGEVRCFPVHFEQLWQCTLEDVEKQKKAAHRGDVKNRAQALLNHKELMTHKIAELGVDERPFWAHDELAEIEKIYPPDT